MPSPPPPPPPEVHPLTVYQETAEDAFDYANDWKEVIGDNQVGGGVTISQDGQESVRVGFIKANKKRAAARYFKGFSYTGVDVAPAGVYFLHREPPARDPEFPQLRCYAVAFQDLVPKADQPHTVTLDEEYVFENPEVAGWKMTKQTSPFKGGRYNETMYYAGYVWCMVTVNYRSFGRTRFIGDIEEVSWWNEWMRYTDWRTEPTMETLSVSGAGSGLKFVETPDGLVGENPNGKQLVADTYELMAMQVVTCRWFAVPHEYLSADPIVLNPTKILACVGKVNDRTMFSGGYKAGTLLMRPPKFDPVLYPVAPADSTTSGEDNTLIGGWDVTLTFLHFDPPKGTAASDYRGHNLFPWRGKGPNGGVELGKWLYCTRNGEESGPPLIPSADFRRIFQHVSDPET